MPTLREYKVALKGASIAFMAGAHSITDAVWQYQSANLSGEKRQTTCDALEKSMKSMLSSSEAPEILADFLNEENLYPFADMWSAETLGVLMGRLKTPNINMADPFEGNTELKFKKGFHKILTDEARKRYVAADEEADIAMSQLDHWLSLILSGAFHSGATTMARMAQQGASFRSALAGLEQESEPWARYVQLGALYDAEMERTEDGGSSTKEGFGFDDDGDEGDGGGNEREGFGFDDEYGDN